MQSSPDFCPLVQIAFIQQELDYAVLGVEGGEHERRPVVQSLEAVVLEEILVQQEEIRHIVRTGVMQKRPAFVIGDIQELPAFSERQILQ